MTIMLPDGCESPHKSNLSTINQTKLTKVTYSLIYGPCGLDNDKAAMNLYKFKKRRTMKNNSDIDNKITFNYSLKHIGCKDMF